MNQLLQYLKEENEASMSTYYFCHMHALRVKANLNPDYKDILMHTPKINKMCQYPDCDVISNYKLIFW